MNTFSRKAAALQTGDHRRRLWRAPVALLLAATVVSVPALAGARASRPHRGLHEILARMNDAARHLKTVSANLDYTHVTVVVNDHSTESGRFLMRNPKKPEMLVQFVKPTASTVLFKRNRVEMYHPKTNQIMEYDLGRHSGVAQQFFRLGFGTGTKSLTASYKVKLEREEDLGGAATAVLSLVPKSPSVTRIFTRIELWVSKASWLPVQQKFYSPDGDYSITRYSDVRVNERLPASTFRIHAAPGAQRVKMN